MIGQASGITKSSPNWVAVWESLISRIFEWLRGVKLDPEILPAAVDIRDFEQVPKDDPLFKYRDTPTVQSPGMAPQQTLDYACEIFKLLQRLFLARAALASRVVVCCAIEQRGENNYISAQAAELLADLTQGSAVCVVDANLDRPSLHTYFDVQNRRGLADAMLETGLILEFTQSIGRGRLQLMSAGVLRTGLRAHEILTLGRIRARMRELQASFDYILIDAPPVGNDSITAQWAALVDGFVLVVEPNFTSRQAARQAKGIIEAGGGRVLGAVWLRRTANDNF
jgi:Cellulose biosynthesis protein BcsQ